MAEFVEVPVTALAEDVLHRLLEEFVSRDGTDYGAQELSLSQKVAQLQCRLHNGTAVLLYDADSEHWDIVDSLQARQLLNGGQPI